MPYDTLSVATLVISAGLLVAAWSGRFPTRARIGFILLAALAIRGDAAYQRSLHVWDESFHALVARNLIDAPLRPVLYRDPALPYDVNDWTANHVWLHKPPGALWLMAASMRVFGVTEPALRVPSVLLSVASVLLTFLIGRRLLTTPVALLAAGFQAVNGFLVALASGRRVADHVDTVLIFFVELAIWSIVSFDVTRRRAWLAAAGLALGAGLLTKTWPAFVILPVAWVILAGAGQRRASSRCAALGMLGVAVALPWTAYTWVHYPVETKVEGLYGLRHMAEAVELQGTAWWTYLADVPRFFGELTPLALALGLGTLLGARAPARGRALIVWLAVPYLVFSVLATRLPGYVMIAAPAMFLSIALGLETIRQRLPASGARRVAGVAAVLLIAASAGRYLLEPTGPLGRRDRSPAFARHLARLEERLKLSDAVLFNVPRPIDAMFYSRYTAYDRMPAEQEVRDLVTRGRAVVIYQPIDRRVPVPEGWPVIVLDERE